MYDRILLPVIRLVINSQPLEQFFFSLEYGLERGNSQRLSEAARTGEKITSSCWTNHIPNILCLIHIQEFTPDKFFK